MEWPLSFIRVWKVKQDFDERCLYTSVYSLQLGAFPCLLVGLEFCPFLSLSVTFYYSSSKKTNLKDVSLYILHLFPISEWPVTLFLSIPNSRGLVAFLVWRRLITSFSSEVLTRSSSLLLYALDNGITSSCNSLLSLNTYFNTRFQSIVRIFSTLSGCAFFQVLLTQT